MTARQVLEVVRRHGTVTAAGRELDRSPAYIYERFNELGLTLTHVLDEPSINELFQGPVPVELR